MRRAIIKHDGTRREGEHLALGGQGGGVEGGTHLQPPSHFSCAQERLSFDLQLDPSAVPLQINHADRTGPTDAVSSPKLHIKKETTGSTST